MKAYLQGTEKRLFINPEKFVPEDVTKTVDTDLESPNGRPVGIYKNEKVEIHVSESLYLQGKARAVGLIGIINNGIVERKSSSTDAIVGLHNYPQIRELYRELAEGR